MDGFKVLVIFIFSLFPKVTETFGDNIYEFGFPFTFISVDWSFVGFTIQQITINQQNFILNIIVGYVVALVIAAIYYILKKGITAVKP